MNDDRIKVRTSIPSLQDKVQTKINGSTEAIYWYIRFNLQLDEESVSGKTMNITDTDGYIMRTVISYKPKHNVISVSPLDSYEENRYYLLNISKKVRSAKGQHLRSTIHILFKLLEGKVADFKVLEDNIEIPMPKPRPQNYDTMQKKPTPTHFEKQYIDRSPPGKMVTEHFSINPFLGFSGLVVVLVGLVLLNLTVIMVGGVIASAGLLHLFMQLQNRELRSTLFFNKGVRDFNNERYSKAEYNFKKALKVNPNNELARHGIRKAEIYRN